MSVDFTATPGVAGEPVTLAAVATAGGDAFVYALTAVPSGSELATGLILLPDPNPPTGALEAHRRQLNADTFTPDVGGVYTIKAYEVRSRRARPAYPGDPAAPGDGYGTLVATIDGQAEVLTLVDFPIHAGVFGGGTLRLGIGDTLSGGVLTGYVRSAEIVDTLDERSRQAAEGAAVVAALTAIEDVLVTTALSDFLTRASNLRAQLQVTTHYDTATWHTGDDTDNPVARVAATSTEAAIQLVNACRSSLVAHMSAVSSGGVSVHTNDDTANEIVIGEASTHGDAAVLLSHLRTSYERHRVRAAAATPPVHLAAGDAVNAVSANTAFDVIVAAYLDELVATDPTAAAGQSVGVRYAVGDSGGRIGS